MAQVKFIVDEELLKRFKQVVIERRGKIELTPEGEEALRLYIEKYEGRRGAGDDGGRDDPLIAAIGAISTEKKRKGGRRSALLDLKELEARP
ncbi:MAG: hypothetical protein ABSF83_00240 [Nitrososphaerales archaeon]|jgi:hypothetical protein